MKAGLTAALILCAVMLSAQSPREEMWLGFLEWNPGMPRIPEDETMGLLADRRSPDASWAGALRVCDEVFAAIAAGQVPDDKFLPTTKVSLVKDFTALLDSSPVSASIRYGRPDREGSRVSVPIRASAESGFSYGRIYLVFRDGEWLIEQWALDLSELSGDTESQGG
ncbi:MAG: hypothetical protein P1P77_00340 [Spirochaetaceae bacterium]|nr:hypothetical protein [Spirochaetaceae bacterium]